MAESEHLGASGYEVTLEKPMHNEVKDDSAYVVVPATMKFTINDEERTQSDALFTVALRKLTDGWTIAAWAWVKGAQQ